MNSAGISAIILAAGYGTRMGRFKPLLPLGDTTVVERVISIFAENRFSDIRVVVGHQRDRLIPLLKRHPVSVVLNPDYPKGMFSSIRAGVLSLKPGTEAFFIHPVDVPLVRPFTVQELLRHYQSCPGRILQPVFKGKPGHPPLIPTSLAEPIMAADSNKGLRCVLTAHDHLIQQVEVPDVHMRFDLDRPIDHRCIIERLLRYDIPTLREIEVICKHIHPISDTIMRHSKKVAETSDQIARALARRGVRLNRKRLRAAALLHDVARGEKNHASVAAGWLADMGFSALSGIVSSHMDLEFMEGENISEAEVLFISDKMVLEDQPVSLAQRYGAALKRYATNNPEAAGKITLRLNEALKIKAKLERAIGACLEDLLEIHP